MAKGGDKKELISAITTKINQYPERLKNDEKIIQDRIAVYKDASLVDDSYYEKVEKEQRKEINRFREAQVASLPESFKTKSGLLFPSKKG
ncbi:MAG: hypothetical protein EBS19_07655 [Spirochaetia bacterium]|nr:hypothetical protein [Spirochaetia bacterium]